MIQNILTFCVKNDLTFVEGSIPSGKLVANDINRNSIYLVTPYDEAIVKANFQTNLQSDTPTSVLGILVNGKIAIDEIVPTSKSYYNLVKDWNIYEFKVPSTTLSFISRNRTGKIGINFSIEQRLVPIIKDSYGEYQGEILSQGQVFTESGYYINKTIDFELDTGDVIIYDLNDILVLTKQELPLDDIQVKISAYSNRGSTPTTLYSVDPSLLNDNFETIEPSLTKQIVQQVNDNTGDIVLLFQNVGVNNATLVDFENRISVNEQDIDTAEGNIANLQGRMATAELDIDHIEDGTTIVEKALKDSLGNVIKRTYANKLDLGYSSSNNRIAITLKSYDGTSLDADLINLPKATTSADGLLAKEDKAYIDGLPSDLALKENKSEKGVANGYASLDSGAKIPSSQLPDSILGQLEYKGTFNPSSGYPASPEKGWFYISIANALISGADYKVGDWAVYNGVSWDKVDNTDAVASVNGKLGAVILYGNEIQVGNGDTWTVEQRIVNIYAELNNRYTKAQTYSNAEIEQRITDLLGLANLQDTAIEFTPSDYELDYNGTVVSTFPATLISDYNWVFVRVLVGSQEEYTIFKPSVSTTGVGIDLPLIQKDVFAQIERVNDDFNFALYKKADNTLSSTTATVRMWGIKLVEQLEYMGYIDALPNSFDFARGLNLLNPDDVEEDCYYTLGGTIVSTDLYRASGLIEVAEGDVITMQRDGATRTMRFVTAYNSSRVAVESSGEERANPYTVPSGIKYIRVSSAKEGMPLATTMICFGTAIKPYEAYYGYSLLLKERAFNNQIVYDILEKGVFPDIDAIENGLDLTTLTTMTGKWKDANWLDTTVSGYNSLLTKKVVCKPGQVFGYRGKGSSSGGKSWAFFDEENQLLEVGYAENQGVSNQSYYLVTAPANASWVQFSSYYVDSGTGELEVIILGFDGLDYLYAEHEKMIKDISSQEIVFSTGVGYFGGNGGFNAAENTSCIYTNRIKTSEGEKFIYRGIGRANFYSCVIWNSAGTIISALQYNSPEDEVEITMPENAAFVRFGSSETDANGRVVQLVCYRVTKEHNAIEKFENLASSNVLWGKKYVACGDSFTEWSTETFVGGRFDKRNKVYPFFIGLRNNMTIVNEAISGSVMTNIDGSSSSKFSVQRYKDIPLDADYITLYFGINDEHQNAPIGTIDDNTNETFYGAWNVVMEYLITNHPFAKIGIIITNGANNDYANAEIAIAKKWGVPYLDINGGYQVPLMLRTNGKSEVCQTAKDLRLSQQRAAVDNTHPNAQAHEYESTFIENFLRTL